MRPLRLLGAAEAIHRAKFLRSQRGRTIFACQYLHERVAGTPPPIQGLWVEHSLAA